MKTLLERLCGDGFMPHGQCYLWSTDLLWLHGLSDALIALAYLSIPAALIHFVRRRRDVPFSGIFLMFGAFIISCGATHILEVWTIWHGHYYLTGGVKALTAVVSLGTAAMLFRIMPDALQLAGPAELRRLNESLEARVLTRTADLETANTSLRREVTERERAEAEVKRLNQLLQRRLEELQALLRILPVGVGIAEDRECRVIRSNDALARLLGLPPEANASLSAPPAEAPANLKVWHNGHLLQAHELPMQVCAREGRAVLDFEEVIERPDGTQVHALGNVIPLHDEAGQVVGCVGTFQDVTALKAAQTSNTRYAAIVASSQDAIVGLDLNQRVTDWNAGAEKIYGHLASEMAGTAISRLFRDDRREAEQAIIESACRGSQVPPFETTRRRSDGRLVEVAITLSPIREPSGRIIGASESARDITEQKQSALHRQELDRKIQETQKLESLGVLAGGIAHDFNNLLTGILGNVSLARSELHPTASIHSFLEQIENSSHRAADLCKQMLAYSGRGRFVVQTIDLNQLVTETTHLLSISISKNCVLRFNLAPQLPPVSVDATQIRQIVMNLVINASEAIDPRSGVIAINTGVARVDEDYLSTLRHDSGLTPGDYVFLEVSDTGCGMDEATIARIFDPFFTTKFTGRGLGLAAVLGIVRGHHGALKVYSEPGRGTTFKLFLPCSTSEAQPAAPRAPTAATERDSGHVLVVDDEETVRTVAARMLERLGYTVETAGDGVCAVEMFRRDPSRYRLVVLDLTMPRLDGEETFRQLRHLQPGVRVVLMSGFNEQEAVARFTGKGLAGFVQKPFEVAGFAAAIRAVTRAG